MDSINKLLGDHCVFTLKPFHPPMQVVQQYIASHEAPLQCTAPILYYPYTTFHTLWLHHSRAMHCGIASHYLTLNRISCIASHDITAPYLKQPRKKKTKTKRILHSLYKKQLCSFFFSGKMGKKNKSISPRKTVCCASRMRLAPV